MTPPPPPVVKLQALLADYTPREWAEVEAWLTPAEREVERVKVALRVKVAADVLEAAAGPSWRAGYVGSGPADRIGAAAPLRLARAMAAGPLPARIADLAVRAGRSESWVWDTLGHGYFRCVREKAGSTAGLYDLSDAGRAALAAAGPEPACA